ncbi:hypothetical protein JH26_00355 [Microvirga sp. BSC39]|jgi:hypothetical protein|nr:hypothetical protein JH26_00355 [Microvirga sp. BSC39]
MNWRLLIPPVVIAVSWTIYLTGILDLPGWEGFSRGMAYGSLPGMAAFALIELYRSRKSR